MEEEIARHSPRIGHSKLPWRVIPPGEIVREPRIVDADRKLIPIASPWRDDAMVDDKEYDANMDLIVRAVNSHDELVGTLVQLKARIEAAVPGTTVPRADLLQLIDTALERATSTPVSQNGDK